MGLLGVGKRLLPYNEATQRRLAIAITIGFSWILIWALVLKLGSEILLVRNYTNLSGMTFEERITWDLIPFNYRGDDYWKMRQVLDTVLNCFVFAPLGVTLCYIFKKRVALVGGLICLGFAVGIETLQLFTVLGNPATEDLITNTAGFFIGYGIYRLLLKRLSTRATVRFLAVCAVLLLIAIGFSIVTTAMAADVIVKILTKAY